MRSVCDEVCRTKSKFTVNLICSVVLPTATSSRLVLQPPVLASSSRTLLKCQWESRRQYAIKYSLFQTWLNRFCPHSVSFKNPLTWVQESLSPAMRDKASEQQTAAVRQEQIEKGEASLFDTIAPEVNKVTQATVTKQRKKHTEVRLISNLHHRYTDTLFL